jgi:excisionase family DNA binding protein
MENKQFYSLIEVGRILGISRISVYNKVKKGEIEAVRIGRSWTVPAKALEYILGRSLRDKDKQEIEAAVKRVVGEFGDVLERLGKE